MNDVKQIRNKLQISQEDLAIYLGITRSLLSLIEIGKRELPINALLKLNNIELQIPIDILPKNLSLVATELLEQKSSLKNYLQQQKDFNKLKIKQLQKKLNALQDEYSKALQLLQVVRLLQQQTPNNNKNKKDILWLGATEAMAIEKINNCGLVAQQKLQTQIDSL